MRRRTKPRVVWLPSVNTFSVDGVSTNRSMWSSVSVTVPDQNNGDQGTLEVPIVMDGVLSDPLDGNSTLSDIESSGYRLRRIVGKLYCFIAQNHTVSTSLIGVTAGFMVRRTNPSTGGSIAAAAGSPPFFGLSPSDIDNSMDPWIWRRSWLLQCGPTFAGSAIPSQITTDNQIARLGPGQNYGAAYAPAFADGPSVDQKTARIVGPEERLFLDVSATTILGTGNAGSTTSLLCIYEFRVLASMRSNIGNRRNASR